MSPAACRVRLLLTRLPADCLNATATAQHAAAAADLPSPLVVAACTQCAAAYPPTTAVATAFDGAAIVSHATATLPGGRLNPSPEGSADIHP